MQTTEVVTCKKERRAAKLCIQCGKPAVGRLCLKHTRADRLRKRVATHSRRWRQGKRGRPPLGTNGTSALTTAFQQALASLPTIGTETSNIQ